MGTILILLQNFIVMSIRATIVTMAMSMCDHTEEIIVVDSNMMMTMKLAAMFQVR